MSLVSVVIPARNAAATIGRTLLSLAQDADVIGEILVIDDGSSDETAAHAVHVADPLGLPVIIHKVSCASAGGSRNHGIRTAKFPLIYFIDADDTLLPGKLRMMVRKLDENPTVKFVIGASIRIAPGQKEMVRTPAGYTDDPVRNAAMYLRNGSPPIAMGSGLVHVDALKSIRFPEKITIDEDTWFWSALLAELSVVVLEETVVSYNLDPQRTANRFCNGPRKTWLAIVREFDHFRKLGVSKDVLDYRKSWLAQRFARQLIKFGRYHEARQMLRPVIAHPLLRREMRTLRYRLISGFGQRFASENTERKIAATSGGGERTMIITHDPAWPPVSGADLRNYQNARMMLRKGPVCLVSVREQETDKKHDGIALISLCDVSGAKSKSINPNRLAGESRISKLARDRLLASIQEFKPDRIIVEGVFLRSLVPYVRKANRQLIVDMHNVESYLASQLELDQSVSRKRQNNTKKLRRAERSLVKQADRVWVCTDEDRTRVLDAYGIRTPIHVVPNGIPWKANADPECLDELSDFRDSPTLIFVGHLGYQPNVDAVERLTRHIFPAVRDVFENAKLHLIGRFPKPQVQALAGVPGVTVIENPDDVRPYLRQADVTIIPLEKGGGSRIKILEATSVGVPVIATNIAAEGLVLTADADIVIANSNATLIAETLDLLRDRKKRAAIRASAFVSVYRLYGDDSIARYVDDGLGL